MEKSEIIVNDFPRSPDYLELTYYIYLKTMKAKQFV